MGGFNIGEIFAALRLDDTEFQRAMERAGGTSRLLNVQLGEMDRNYVGLLNTLNSAGYGFQNVAKWMDNMRMSGWSTAQAINMVSDALNKAQDRARQLETRRVQFMAPLDDQARTRASEVYMSNLHAMEKMYQAERKSTTEAAREHDRAVKERARAEREAAKEREGLNKKLADEERRTNDQLLKDKLTAIEANRRHYAQFDAERTKRDKDYANLVRQLAREEAQAPQRAAAAERARRHDEYFQYRSQSSSAFAMTTLGLSATAAGAVPLLAMGAATKEFANFDQAMTKSLSIMGDVSEFQERDMTRAARALAKETGKSVEELAGAYYFLKSAGLDARESMEQLPAVTKFSIAANADLEKSTDLLTSAMSSMGLGAKDIIRISDALVRADKDAKGSALDFAEALAGKGGGALRLNNKSLEEGVAILTTYAKVGIKGKEAQEALNQVLRDFAKTTIKDKVVELNGEIFKFGQIAYDASGKMRPFWDIIGDLEKRMKGMSDLQKREFFTGLGFQDRSVKSLTSILGWSGFTKEMYDSQMGQAAGSTEGVFKKQMDTYNKQVEILKARGRDIELIFGKPITEALLNLMNTLDPAVVLLEKAAGVGIAALGTATVIAKLNESFKDSGRTPVNPIGVASTGGVMDWALDAYGLGGALDKHVVKKTPEQEIAEWAKGYAKQGPTYSPAQQAMHDWEDKFDLKIPGAGGKEADPYSILGITNYTKRLKEMKDALEQIRGTASSVEMDQALKNIQALEREATYGDRKTLKETLAAYNDEVRKNAEFAEKSNSVTVQWGHSQSQLASLFNRTAAEMQKVKEVEIEGSGRRPSGVPASSWGRGTDPSLSYRLPSDVFAAFAQQMDVETAMRAVGNKSQGALNAEWMQAKKRYEDIAAVVGKSAWEARVLWVASVEAQARATHDKSLLMSKDYLNVKRSIEDVNKTARVELNHTRQQVSTIITDLSSGIFDALWPKQFTGGKDNLSEVTSILRGGYEGLAQKGYADPKAAMQGVLADIQRAATLNEANAIAVRHFGDNGVLLVKAMRDGSLSADDLSTAVGRATTSITEFSEQSEKRLDRVNEIFRQLAKSVTRALVEDFAEAAAEHINIWGNLGKVWDKMGGWLGIGGGSAAPAVAASAGAIPDSLKKIGIGSAPSVPSAPSGGGGGGGGGGVASSLGSFSSIFNMVTGGISAAAGVGSFVMDIRQEGTLNAIEHETRYSQIHLLSILDLHNKYIPYLEGLTGYMYGVQAPALAEALTLLQGGGGGGTAITIQGDVVLQNVNDPDSFVRELKARRALR
jgi:TP901 family phage tail tape measure protein